MKIICSIHLVFVTLSAFSQNNGDAIVGKWMKTPRETLLIEVFKSEEVYKGKIDWSNDEAKKPEGYVILQDMKYNHESKVWEGGKIHDPASGKTYKAIARIKADGLLEVQGYMGMKFLNSKRYFKRVD